MASHLKPVDQSDSDSESGSPLSHPASPAFKSNLSEPSMDAAKPIDTPPSRLPWLVVCRQHWMTLWTLAVRHMSQGRAVACHYNSTCLAPACQHPRKWCGQAQSFIEAHKLPKWTWPAVASVVAIAVAVLMCPWALGDRDFTAGMVVPGFGPAAMIASDWAESFARQMGNNTLPAAATLVTLRLASEQLALEAGLRDFVGNKQLIQKLDESAMHSQQASDNLVAMLTGAEGAINRMTSYTAFLELSLDANKVYGSSETLVKKFQNYLDQLDDEFDTVIFKAEAAYKSLETLQQSLLTSSAVTGLAQKQETVPEKAWYCLWTPEASPKLLDNLSYLNGTAASLHKSRVEVASVRLNLQAFREKLHQLKAGALAGHDDLPIEVQRPFLRNALQSLMLTQDRVQGYTQLPAALKS